MKRAILLASLASVLAGYGCSRTGRLPSGQLEQLHSLGPSAAEPVTGGDSCVRVHHLWKTQARIAIEMGESPPGHAMPRSSSRYTSPIARSGMVTLVTKGLS